MRYTSYGSLQGSFGSFETLFEHVSGGRRLRYRLGQLVFTSRELFSGRCGIGRARASALFEHFREVFQLSLRRLSSCDFLLETLLELCSQP